MLEKYKPSHYAEDLQFRKTFLSGNPLIVNLSVPGAQLCGINFVNFVNPVILVIFPLVLQRLHVQFLVTPVGSQSLSFV